MPAGRKERKIMKIYYQHPNTWFGDCMPFGKDDTFYLFHQRDTRVPCPFGEPFGWDLATTSDFVHYEDKGVAIPRGTDEEQDQFIFAGSVFEAEGQYHIFYTGYNRDYPALGKPSQVLMHAYSDDLVTWHKTQDALTFTPQEGYDPDDWRDPWVIRDEENDQYLLILGARLQGPKTRQTGRTVKFTSKDLKNWKFEGDFWAPDLYTMHEMPDLFKIGDWWYHIVTEYSDRSKMVYRMSKSLNGPWIAPKDDAFDGRAYYAGRTFELNGQRILFGWVATKDQDDDVDGKQEDVLVGRDAEQPVAEDRRQRREHGVVAQNQRHGLRHIVGAFERELPVQREVPHHRRNQRNQIARPVAPLGQLIEQREQPDLDDARRGGEQHKFDRAPDLFLFLHRRYPFRFEYLWT